VQAAAKPPAKLPNPMNMLNRFISRAVCHTGKGSQGFREVANPG
jgi:hypothetical protein